MPPISHEGQTPAQDEQAGIVARAAIRLTAWTEKWVPDAFIFALVATLIVFAAALVWTPSSFTQVVDAWGNGFWDLIPFTLQMSLIIITGHVLATSAPVGRAIRAIAGWPRTPRGAVALVTLFALGTSWFNWGFSLIFSAVLAKEVARRVRGVDYRALAAASVLGIGSIWAQGLSGSAALQMATPGALQPQIRDIVANGGVVPGGIIPFSETIFLWQSFVSVFVEVVVVTLVMWLATPPASKAKTAAALGINLGEQEFARVPSPRPQAPAKAGVFPHPQHDRGRDWRGVPGSLLRSRGRATQCHHREHHQLCVSPGRRAAASDPRQTDASRAGGHTGGVGRDSAVSVLCGHCRHHHVDPPEPATRQRLRERLDARKLPGGGGDLFGSARRVRAVRRIEVGDRSAVRDGGGARAQVHLGWVVAAYDLGEALANLVQPFWMLPILGMFGLRARDVMGYTFIVFLALTPVVILLVTLLGATLPYPL